MVLSWASVGGGGAMSVAVWSGPLVAWERELAALKERIGPVFGRAETRETAGAFLDGLLSGVARKTGWLLAEQAGLERPYRMQSVLSSNSVVGQRMAVSFGIEFHHGVLDGAVEVLRSREGLMGEVMPLQVGPETLDVVQLRSIVRQPLDPEPVGARGERGAACLAGVDRAVVQDEHEGLDRDAELGTIAPVDLLQESDEVRASFGPAGVHNELALRPVEHPEHRHFRRLARRRNAQIGPSLGPDVRQVRMGERFGLVPEEQHDVTGLSLRFEQLSAQARPVHGIRILAALQRVAGSPPAEAPFFLSTTDSREIEMRTPARISISSAKRGSVQFG